MNETNEQTTESGQTKPTIYSSDGRELNEIEAQCLTLVGDYREATKDFFESIVASTKADPRWAAIAKTHFQEGFMALTRAITKPTTF